MANGSLHDEFAHSTAQRLRTFVLVFLLAVVPLTVVLIVGRWALGRVTARPDVQVFAASFLSIIFEALPFILLGAILSGLLEVFVPSQMVLRFVPRSRLGQLAAGAVAGVVLPVCECGIIVIVRRLLRKGMPLPMALAYMLVAPIVNPVVIISTFAAFRGKSDWLLMPVARVAVGIAAGMAIAAWVGRAKFLHLVKVTAEPPATHGDKNRPGPSVGARLSAAADHALNDFLDVGPFLIVGATVAGVVQTVVARDLLTGIGQSPVLAVPGMMALAVLLNLCSEADAFVAVSFSATFSFASQLAFLVLGPMLDLKLMIMYTSAFRRRMILILVPTIVLVVYVATELVALAEYYGWGK